MKHLRLGLAVAAACLIAPGFASAQQDPARPMTSPTTPPAAVERSDNRAADKAAAERREDRKDAAQEAREDRKDAAENRAEMRASTAAGSGWQARQILGLKVHGSNNEKIGEIHDLVVDDQGQVKSALVDVGGFLGMGEKTVAIDWKQVTVNAADKTARVTMTKDQLTAMPKWEEKRQTSEVPRDRSVTDRPATGPAMAPARNPDARPNTDNRIPPATGTTR